MFSDTLLYDCTLRALYHHAIREGALARMVGVMSAGIGVGGRFYNTVRGL
jgi:hypothetical protein